MAVKQRIDRGELPGATNRVGPGVAEIGTERERSDESLMANVASEARAQQYIDAGGAGAPGRRAGAGDPVAVTLRKFNELKDLG